MPNLKQRSRFFSPLLPLAWLLLTFFLIPHGIRAQEEVNPILRGQVLKGEEPLGGAMVVLHKVSAEGSGEVDSIQARGDGSFSLPLPHVPDHGVTTEVYFASIRFRGLLYFGPALTAPTQLDSLYLIRAFDTLSVPQGGATLTMAQRSLFLDRDEDGWEATDFFQLFQEEDRTLFSPEDGVVWSYPLPEGATNFQVGQTDLSPDAFRFEGGRFEVFSPLPPGERFFLVRYTIPQDDLEIPTPGTTNLMQVLVRDPGPEVEFSSLAPGQPVELEPGNLFRNYEATNVRDGVIEGKIVAEPFQLSPAWLGVLLAALLGGIGVWGYRRGSSEPTPMPQRTGEMDRRAVILAVASLDETFQAKADPSPEEEDRYRARRAELLGHLRSRD